GWRGRLSPLRDGRRHAPAGGGEVLRRQLGHAEQFIALCVTRIARCEERDVRVISAGGRDSGEVVEEALWGLEPDDSGRWVEVRTEALRRKVIEQSLFGGRRGAVEARIELAPEEREEAIGAEAGGNQQPDIRAARVVAAELGDRF